MQITGNKPHHDFSRLATTVYMMGNNGGRQVFKATLQTDHHKSCPGCAPLKSSAFLGENSQPLRGHWLRPIEGVIPMLQGFTGVALWVEDWLDWLWIHPLCYWYSTLPNTGRSWSHDLNVCIESLTLFSLALFPWSASQLLWTKQLCSTMLFCCDIPDLEPANPGLKSSEIVNQIKPLLH